eukprot:g2496.t1
MQEREKPQSLYSQVRQLVVASDFAGAKNTDSAAIVRELVRLGTVPVVLATSSATASQQQVAKDIARDSFVVNGSATIEGAAVTAELQHALAAHGVVARAAPRVVRSILTAAARTVAGGDSYFAVQQRFGGPSVLVRPSQQQPPPIHINIEGNPRDVAASAGADSSKSHGTATSTSTAPGSGFESARGAGTAGVYVGVRRVTVTTTSIYDVFAKASVMLLEQEDAVPALRICASLREVAFDSAWGMGAANTSAGGGSSSRDGGSGDAGGGRGDAAVRQLTFDVHRLCNGDHDPESQAPLPPPESRCDFDLASSSKSTGAGTGASSAAQQSISARTAAGTPAAAPAVGGGGAARQGQGQGPDEGKGSSDSGGTAGAAAGHEAAMMRLRLRARVKMPPPCLLRATRSSLELSWTRSVLAEAYELQCVEYDPHAGSPHVSAATPLPSQQRAVTPPAMAPVAVDDDDALWDRAVTIQVPQIAAVGGERSPSSSTCTSGVSGGEHGLAMTLAAQAKAQASSMAKVCAVVPNLRRGRAHLVRVRSLYDGYASGGSSSRRQQGRAGEWSEISRPLLTDPAAAGSVAGTTTVLAGSAGELLQKPDASPRSLSPGGPGASEAGSASACDVQVSRTDEGGREPEDASVSSHASSATGGSGNGNGSGSGSGGGSGVLQRMSMAGGIARLRGAATRHTVPGFWSRPSGTGPSDSAGARNSADSGDGGGGGGGSSTVRSTNDAADGEGGARMRARIFGTRGTQSAMSALSGARDRAASLGSTLGSSLGKGLARGKGLLGARGGSNESQLGAVGSRDSSADQTDARNRDTGPDLGRTADAIVAADHAGCGAAVAVGTGPPTLAVDEDDDDECDFVTAADVDYTSAQYQADRTGDAGDNGGNDGASASAGTCAGAGAGAGVGAGNDCFDALRSWQARTPSPSQCYHGDEGGDMALATNENGETEDVPIVAHPLACPVAVRPMADTTAPVTLEGHGSTYDGFRNSDNANADPCTSVDAGVGRRVTRRAGGGAAIRRGIASGGATAKATAKATARRAAAAASKAKALAPSGRSIRGAAREIGKGIGQGLDGLVLGRHRARGTTDATATDAK